MPCGSSLYLTGTDGAGDPGRSEARDLPDGSSSPGSLIVTGCSFTASGPSTVDTLVTLTASGYASSSPISISLMNSGTVCTGTTDSSGYFSCVYLISPPVSGRSEEHTSELQSRPQLV